MCNAYAMLVGGPIFNKHFKPLHAWYTFNYFFEFGEGHVSMQSLCSTPNNEAINIPLVNATNISLICQSLLSEICSMLALSQSNMQHSYPSVCRLHPCYHSLKRSWSPWAKSASQFPSNTYRTTLKFLVFSTRRLTTSKSRRHQWHENKKRQLATIDAMVESTPNTPAPSALVKARPRRPMKKVVIALGPPQKSTL